MRKIGCQTKDEHQDLGSSYSYRLIEMSSLLSAFQPLHQCESGGQLQLKDDKARRYGNGSVLQIECSKCDTKLELQTSGNTSETWTNQSSKDVNRRMVYAASEMGVTREAMSTMCDIFNMPQHPKHRFKGPKSVEMAAMSVILQFNSGASSRHQVMEAFGIPAGEFTLQGSARKDSTRIFHSVKKAATCEKDRRRKIRQAKLAANMEENEGECSYSSGKFNEVDPLAEVGLEPSDSDDEDSYPLARLLLNKDSDTSDEDNLPLAQLLHLE